MKKISIIVIIIILIAVVVYLVLQYAKSPSITDEKVCVADEDCVVFGETGDCNCGCFNKNHNWEKEGDCFCLAPKSCKCVEGVCEDVFEEPIVEGWETYTNERLRVKINYPSEMTISSESGGIKFVFMGPTQGIGTELYDGIIFYIFRESYEENSLREFAEAQIEEEKKYETTITQELEEWTLGKLDGYFFEVEGLGTFTNIIIDAGQGEAIKVTYLAPGSQDQGYQDTVNKMLSTLELLEE